MPASSAASCAGCEAAHAWAGAATAPAAPGAAAVSGCQPAPDHSALGACSDEAWRGLGAEPSPSLPWVIAASELRSTPRVAYALLHAPRCIQVHRAELPMIDQVGLRTRLFQLQVTWHANAPEACAHRLAETCRWSSARGSLPVLSLGLKQALADGEGASLLNAASQARSAPRNARAVIAVLRG